MDSNDDRIVVYVVDDDDSVREALGRVGEIARAGQRAAVMSTVQVLRRKAYDAGNLKAGAEQKVVVDKQVSVIEPATTTVYVPVYNPTIVYGTWWHVGYVPYYYYPPAYRPGAPFMAGVVVGAALWGGCNWRGNDVTINVNRYNQFNRTSITRASWEHDTVHRKGAAYRDPAVAQKYNRNQAADVARRDAARGPTQDVRPAATQRDADRPGPRERDDDAQDRDRPARPSRDRKG